MIRHGLALQDRATRRATRLGRKSLPPAGMLGATALFLEERTTIQEMRMASDYGHCWHSSGTRDVAVWRASSRLASVNSSLGDAGFEPATFRV